MVRPVCHLRCCYGGHTRGFGGMSLIPGRIKLANMRWADPKPVVFVVVVRSIETADPFAF